MRNRFFVSTSANGKVLDERTFTWLFKAHCFAVGCSAMLLDLAIPDSQVTVHDRKKGKVIQWMVTDGSGKAGHVSETIQSELPQKLFRNTQLKDEFGENARARAGFLSILIADSPKSAEGR